MGFGPHPSTGKWYGRYKANAATPRFRSNLAVFNVEHGQREPLTRKEAQAAFEHMCAQVRSGEAFAPKDASRAMTVEAYVAYYRENHFDTKDHFGEGDKAIFNVVARHFGSKPLLTWNNPHTFVQFHKFLRTSPIDITIRRKNAAGEWIIERKPSKRLRTAKTIKDYKIRLAHMVKKAVTWKLLDTNPFEDDDDLMGTYTKGKGRCRGVTEAEEEALFAACDKLPEQGDAMRERLTLKLFYGVRRKTMQQTQLKDIDFKNWVWKMPAFKHIDGKKKIDGNAVPHTVQHTKDGQDHEIPIVTEDIRKIFLAKRKLFDPDSFLFGENGRYVKSFKTAWATLKTHAKLDDVALRKKGRTTLHWHDLRGEAGTRLLRAGVPPAIVAEILCNTVEVLMANYKGDLMDAMRQALVKGAK